MWRWWVSSEDDVWFGKTFKGRVSKTMASMLSLLGICLNPGWSTSGRNEKVIRSDITNHCLDCVYEFVSCRYAVIGCKCKIPHRSLETHESDSLEHLELIGHWYCYSWLKQQSTIKHYEDDLQRLENLIQRKQNAKIEEQKRKKLWWLQKSKNKSKLPWHVNFKAKINSYRITSRSKQCSIPVRPLQ